MRGFSGRRRGVSMRSISVIGAGVVLLTALFASTTMAASPNSGTAVVDGATGDWSLGADFFADMTDAGKADADVRAKLYLKYDCEEGVLYALVLVQNGEKGRQERTDEAYVAIDGSKEIDSFNGEFAWVNGDGVLADGFEGSAELEPGSYSLRAHILVADDSADGYTPMDVIGRTVPLDIECNDEEPTDEEPTDEEPTDPTDPGNPPGGGVGPTTGTRPTRTLPPTDTIETITAPSSGVGIVLAVLGVGSLATLVLTFGRRRQPVGIEVEETIKH